MKTGKSKFILLNLILIVMTLSLVIPLHSFAKSRGKDIIVEFDKKDGDTFENLTFDYWKVEDDESLLTKENLLKIERTPTEELKKDNMFGPSNTITTSDLDENSKAYLDLSGFEDGVYIFKMQDESFLKLKNYHISTFFVRIDDCGNKIIIKVTDKGILLNKVDSDSKTPLCGVEFKLYECEDKNKKDPKLVKVSKDDDGNYYLDENGKIETLKTDLNGQIRVYGLKRDKYYYFVETKTKPNYQIIESETGVLVYGSTVEVENKKIPENPKDKGKIKFVKVDKDDETKHLKNAQFLLLKYDENKKEFIAMKKSDGDYILTSNSRGEFETGFLEYGTYKLQEIKAPDGYELNPSPIEFKIDKDSYTGDTIITIFIENTKIPPGNNPPSEENPPPGPPGKTENPPTGPAGKTDNPHSEPPGRSSQNPPRSNSPVIRSRTPSSIVKTGDIRIFIFIGIGLVMIILGVRLLKKKEKVS